VRRVAGFCLGLLLAALSLPAAAADTLAPFPVAFGGPFMLTDHTGTARTDADYRGRYLLVYFGYTFCPDICPTSLQTMIQALDDLGAQGDEVQPLFVSVDPARDTPAALADYVAAFHPRLVGLTGSEAQVRAAAKAYRVHRRKVPTHDDEAAEDYLVDHGSLTYLMGPDGRFVTLFPFMTTPERMTQVLRKYLGAEG